MKNFKSFLIVLLSLSNLAQADGVVYLNKGQTAPSDGFLFPPPEAVEMKNALVERDSLRLLNTSLNTTVKLQSENMGISEQRIELYRKQNDELAKSLYSSQSMNNWERIGWFFLGIAGTGFALYGIQKVTH